MTTNTLTLNDFVQAFNDYNCEDNFSYEGLEALYNYYNDHEKFELDVIAICCEWSEYGSVEEVLEYYDVDSLEFLQNHYSIILLDNNRCLVQDF